MTFFKVKLSSLMGLSFYRYEITPNDYNPNIDSNIIITVKCTNIFGIPTPNKNIQLYLNNESLGSDYVKVTDENGIATFTYKVVNWGIQDFSVINVHCQVNVKGWKIISGSLSNSGWQLERNETRARLVTTTWSHAVTTSWQQFGSSAYAVNVKPKSNVHYSIDTRVVWYIDRTTGKIYFKSATGSNIASTTFAMQWEWSIA